ncbi:MAG: GlgB N-terminal domain-containing protein, partial [Methylobacter sp.]
MKKQSKSELDFEMVKIVEARHHDPFSVLGRHQKDDGTQIKLYMPYAETVSFSHNGIELPRIPGTDFFEYNGENE